MKFFFAVVFLFSVHCGSDADHFQSFADSKVYPAMVDSLVNIKIIQKDKSQMELSSNLRYLFSTKDTSYVEFVDSVRIDFFNTQSNDIATKIRCDYAKVDMKGEVYLIRGKKVTIKRYNGDQLTTTELYWYKNQRIIQTDKDVYIKKGSKVIYGVGLEATDDLKEYTINQIRGTFYLD